MIEKFTNLKLGLRFDYRSTDEKTILDSFYYWDIPQLPYSTNEEFKHMLFNYFNSLLQNRSLYQYKNLQLSNMPTSTTMSQALSAEITRGTKTMIFTKF